MNKQKLDRQVQHYIQVFDMQMREKGINSQSRRVYCSRVRNFFSILQDLNFDTTDFFRDQEIRDRACLCYRGAVREYLKPGSINGVISTMNLFLQNIGLSSEQFDREFYSVIPEKTLRPQEISRLLSTLDRLTNRQEQVIIILFLYTGIKIGQCAKLDLEDLSVRNDVISVRLRNSDQLDFNPSVGKNREATLPPALATLMYDWIKSREQAAGAGQALLLNKARRRMSISSIDAIVRKIGWFSNLVISAEMLRRTYFKTQVREEAAAAKRPATREMQHSEPSWTRGNVQALEHLSSSSTHFGS